MPNLHNTLYVTSEGAYVSKSGESAVVKVDGSVRMQADAAACAVPAVIVADLFGGRRGLKLFSAQMGAGIPRSPTSSDSDSEGSGRLPGLAGAVCSSLSAWRCGSSQWSFTNSSRRWRMRCQRGTSGALRTSCAGQRSRSVQTSPRAPDVKGCARRSTSSTSPRVRCMRS